MALSTSLLIAIWGVIGLASTLYNNFLPFLLTSRGAQFGDGSLYLTYRNVILSLMGVPGAFLAGWAVELPYLGRRGTLSISCGLTSAFLFATTTARNSVQLLGFNCGYVFFSNIMYGVLYAMSPELFAAKDRGTGNALVSTSSRLFGVVAPIIALYGDLTTAVPVYVSGGLIMASGVLAWALPFETCVTVTCIPWVLPPPFPRCAPPHRHIRASLRAADDSATHPPLNIPNLDALLQIHIGNAKINQNASSTRKRRADSPPPPPTKRHKPHSAPSEEWPVASYPQVDEPRFPIPAEDSHVPALSHSFDLSFSTSGDITREESNLAHTLASLPAETTFELGGIGFAVERDRRVAIVSELLHKRDGISSWLLHLPSLEDEVDLTAFGVDSVNHDIIGACLQLQELDRVSVCGRLSLVLLPGEASEQLPFILRVTVSVAFLPALFHEPVNVKRQLNLIEDWQRRVLQYAHPDPRLSSSESVTNVSFFYSALRPAPPIVDPASMQPDDLRVDLLPFQRRSVAWLLQREGVSQDADQAQAFSFWERFQEGAHPEDVQARGAILAEEPGLGKTIETLALLLLNPAPPDRKPGHKHWDPLNELHVECVKSTLIVTPPALVAQWMDELKQHAPSLKVFFYEGWSKLKLPPPPKSKPTGKKRKKGSDDDEEVPEPDWPSFCHQYDVVITTYAALRAELNVARAPPKRPRREDVVYSSLTRTRSALIRVEWLRVLMDESQLVGGGNVEDMVAMIPRLASFAVSGTPARIQVADLSHTLKFLRVEHIVGGPRYWARLLTPLFSRHFATFFQSLAVRTTKASVKDELTIPQQSRYVVPISMGVVERSVYDNELEALLLQLGLDARGVDVRGEEARDPDAGLLRSAIRRLRAICTHPQVGQLGNKVFKTGGALKTMDQVLQGMRNDNWSLVIEDARLKIQSLVRIAQLQQRDVDHNRYQNSLETLLVAEKDAMQMIEEIESAIAAHQANAPPGADPVTEDNNSDTGKGKGKERERSSSPLSDVESDDEEGGDESDLGLKEYRSRRRALKSRLREAQLVMHRVKFLQGDVYHTLGEAHAAAETTAYEAAESIRRVLLSSAEREAEKAIKILQDNRASDKALTVDDLLIDEPFLDSDDEYEAIEEANEVIETVINPQSRLIFEWRDSLTALLTKRLTPGEDADGQEYQRTLDDQGEAESYLRNYSALLADHREAFLKERSLLAKSDAAEKKARHTKAAIKAAAALDDPELNIQNEIELQPEHEVLYKQLAAQRKGLLTTLDGRALKSCAVELLGAARKVKNDDKHEGLKAVAKDLQDLISSQGPISDKMDADLAVMRKAFNVRIQYFKQLQDISDAVAEVTYETTVADALQECITEQNELAGKISTNRARQRYLDHISKTHEADDDEDEAATCILCRCDFLRGFITQCAHVFCEDCLKLWLKDKARYTCPVCRIAIDPAKLERFVVSEVEKPAYHGTNDEPVPKSRRKIEYNCVDPALLKKIQSVACFGDYGRKIQTLVQHLLHLRTVDRGSKSIVFSAWADSLYIIERALRDNGISCLRIDQNRKGQTAVRKFASEEDIEVLLLHGERENAGLNITCASRVFLLESVVHHGFEIQAIARIDRMGQKKPTEVYCYYAEDTVEKNILDLAARQGLSLYTKDHSEGSLNVASLAGDENKKIDASPKKNKRNVKGQQKGDFILSLNDMLEILFPHMFEDFEYMVVEEAMEGVESTNAVAGPSRLH
ncbi:SNF2 family helicase [Mycena kentingensis (nom. inval.)]|nr:SNF2 family helicase [Mycena kentingensis (nom. inval.)]